MVKPRLQKEVEEREVKDPNDDDLSADDECDISDDAASRHLALLEATRRYADDKQACHQEYQSKL